MAQATISSKYQIVIPREIRSEMPLASGQVVQILAKGGVVMLVPDRTLSSLCGYLKGMKTDGMREKRERG